MFKGSYSVTITPTSNDGKIKVKSLEKYFDWQIKKKIGGLIILGRSGEFLSISDQNRSKMIRESVSIVDNRVPLLVGTAAENTYDAIKYSVEAQAKNADSEALSALVQLELGIFVNEDKKPDEEVLKKAITEKLVSKL